MTASLHDLDFASLPTEERYQLAMALLDSVFCDRQAEPVLPSHLAEVRRRVAAMDAHPVSVEPWRNVIRRILGQA